MVVVTVTVSMTMTVATVDMGAMAMVAHHTVLLAVPDVTVTVAALGVALVG